MDCKHERLRTKGDQVFCCDCGGELPLSFLTERNRRGETPAEKVPEEKPAEKKPARAPAKKKAGKAG